MIQLIITTWPNNNNYKEFIKKILDQKLAACINVNPKVESFFYWNDEFCQESEFIFFIKTSIKMQDKLIQFINEHHPYKCPEILILNVNASDDYTNWLKKNLNIM